MNTQRMITLLGVLATACGSPRAGVDDESSETTSSTSDETSGADAEADTSDDGSVFTPEPDTGWTKYACDSILQDCPEGEKCVPYASSGGNWDALKCVPVLGDQAPGEPCTWDGIVEATDTCNQDSMCWNAVEVDGEWIGTCHPFCYGNPSEPECPAGSQCEPFGQSAISLCFPQCDPIEQDCASGLACYWDTIEFGCHFTSQDIPAGEPCGFVNDCAAGLSCFPAALFPACAGANCCSPFCDIELGDAQCDVVPGTSCVALFSPGEAPPGYEKVGVCLSP